MLKLVHIYCVHLPAPNNLHHAGISRTRMLLLVTFLPVILAQLDDLAAICNPLMETCAPNPALSGVLSTDFTQGESTYWTVYSGPPLTFGVEGATFTASQNNSNQIMASISYVMFGRVEVVMKRSLGTGIVASLNFQSDAGDEISFTWHGAERVVRLSWLGLGIQLVPGRESNVTDGTMVFNTYTVDWTPKQTQWTINGAIVRTVTRADDVPSNTRYPQTPTSIKMGIWNIGDYEDPATAAWGGGPIDWSCGPYNISAKSITLMDYSSGQAYRYSDQTGRLESIVSLGGSINGSFNIASPASPVAISSMFTSSLMSTPTSGTASSSIAEVANASQGLTIAAKAGIGVGAGLAGLILLSTAFAIWKKKRSIQTRKIDLHRLSAGLLMQQEPGVAVD